MIYIEIEDFFETSVEYKVVSLVLEKIYIFNNTSKEHYLS